MQGIKGVPPLKEGLNPATWMLEVSTPGAEQRTGVDFAEIYKNSDFARYAFTEYAPGTATQCYCHWTGNKFYMNSALIKML